MCDYKAEKVGEIFTMYDASGITDKYSYASEAVRGRIKEDISKASKNVAILSWAFTQYDECLNTLSVNGYLGEIATVSLVALDPTCKAFHDIWANHKDIDDFRTFRESNIDIRNDSGNGFDRFVITCAPDFEIISIDDEVFYMSGLALTSMYRMTGDGYAGQAVRQYLETAIKTARKVF